MDGATVGTWPDSFEPGDRVMIWRTSGLPAPATSGSTAPLLLDGEVGRWYVTRVVARQADRLTLADPLPFACPADEAQVIKLPELDVVTVNPGSELYAEDWQSEYGGFVGFYANELVIDNGLVSAGSDGFNGGDPEDFGDFNNCTALDGRSPSGGGAAKGQSLVPSRYGIGVSLASGRGNIYHGGGGGDCRNAGGGGGGGALGGAGGTGGFDSVDRPVGGMPGVPVRFSPVTHLTMGGGGGAGENNASTSGFGGYGGGVVWLTVRTIRCTNGGAITASGGSGSGMMEEGGGGGGGGGLVWIRAESITGCSVRAIGGDGGSSSTTHGPGGGGGGGKLVIVTDAATGVTTNVIAGTPGSGLGAAGGQNGAVCGNGTVEPGETCDDGNYRPGDACTYCIE
jgi:cysteine-rich repeat protein